MAHIVKCRICKQQFDTEKLLKMVLHMQMRSISELQKAIKTHRIISFIAGGDDGE
jgi:hypothetical protein